MSDPRVRVSQLRVTLPNGAPLLRDINLEVAAGEVVVLVGGSGSGKSTLSRALFEPDQLSADGFELAFDTLAVDKDELGLVPQRGALFDHLDVGENLELAMRSGGQTSLSVGELLESVSLNASLAGARTSSLSGGQAQRVAVARALAAGRKILFLDEPSVGLDPARVRELARVVREQTRRHDIASIVVTHDVALAAGLADRILFLDPQAGALSPLFEGEWPGALEDDGVDEATRSQWLARLEHEIVSRIDEVGEPDRRGDDRGGIATVLAAAARHTSRAALRPFAVGAASLAALPHQLFARPADFGRIALRTARQTLLRPLPFYAIVAALIGYTILFVISKVGGEGVRPDALIRQIGGSYVLALAPPLSAILFVAASGAASNAWLGSITLTRQVTALEALGVKPAAYVWAPTWLVIGLSYLAVATLFSLAMLAGGWVLARQTGLENAFELLTADFLDPRPERQPHLWRAGILVWIYAWGIASDVVAKGTSAKRDADAVTRSMTGSVVACTSWVVGWELVSALWVFR